MPGPRSLVGIRAAVEFDQGSPGTGLTDSSSTGAVLADGCVHAERSDSFLASSAQAIRAFLLAIATSVR
jgi:hypothetical protein